MNNKPRWHRHLDKMEERLNERLDEIQELLTKVALMLARSESTKLDEKHGLCRRYPPLNIRREQLTELTAKVVQKEWHATHSIGDELVMLVLNDAINGPAYTKEEWDGYDLATHELTHGEWYFQGEACEITRVEEEESTI